MKKPLIIILALIIILGGIYYGYYYLTTGNVSVYIQDPPNDPPLKIYITITSIMIHKIGASNDSWITISNKTITVMLTSNITFLVSARIPAGEYNEVFLKISSAQIDLNGLNISEKLPSGVFKIHIINGMYLKGGSSESLLISFPHVTFANGEIIISPSVTAQVIES